MAVRRALVGDVQGVSDLEAPPGIKVGEAWPQQNMLGNRLSLLAGRYDVSTEFDFTRSGSLFLNNSLGIAPEFALSGVRGPSIYPLTAAGVRLAIKATRNAVVRLAMLADALRVGEIALLPDLADTLSDGAPVQRPRAAPARRPLTRRAAAPTPPGRSRTGASSPPPRR